VHSSKIEMMSKVVILMMITHKNSASFITNCEDKSGIVDQGKLTITADSITYLFVNLLLLMGVV
jgi:hypothetical protein